MYRPVLLLLLVISITCGNEFQQETHGVESLASLTGDPNAQIAALQRNISSLWTYIYELRGSVEHHLNHLREHQVQMENAIHRFEHHGDGHGDSHSTHTGHSGEQHSHGSSHSHSGEQHSHSGENHGGHSSEHHHHSGEHHSHGSDDHSHGSDDHSHGSDDHSHSGEHAHYHDSHSHSHTDGAGHDDHNHGHDHKDSHENTDDLQQTSQVAEPLVEPVVVPTNVQVQPTSRHSHHHSHGSHSHGSHSHGSHSHSSSSTGGSTFQPLNVMDHHHGHGSSSMVRNRTRTVLMPKYSEYDLYHFAVCNIQANRAIPVEKQQNIVGQISLWQKKSGGPLNIHVRASGFAMGDHHHHHQQQQQQQDQLQKEDDNETPTPMVHKHGFHIHTFADFSNGCQTTGPHYNPKGSNHGAPNALVRHVGDLGNIECDDHGVANLAFSDDVASLVGQYSVIGKSMVMHSGQDDLGLGGNDESLKTGNAGVRIACCAIEKVDKLPIRSYKAMKTAIQYQNY